MTGGNTVILGEVGDNFAAGMTGGMAFVYDPDNNLEDVINPNTVIWQRLETKYWIDFLHSLVIKHVDETSSMYAKKILNDWDLNQKYFYQICPKEMLDKLEHPISLQESKKQAV
jgi:glutamate synthase (NADPH/NADH) large chain